MQGKLDIRKTVDSEIVYTHVYIEESRISAVIETLMKGLFGDEGARIENSTLVDLKLPKRRNTVLTGKKIESIQSKYFSIPPGKLDYYPTTASSVTKSEVSSDLAPKESLEVTDNMLRLTTRINSNIVNSIL